MTIPAAGWFFPELYPTQDMIDPEQGAFAMCTAFEIARKAFLIIFAKLAPA